METKPWKLMKKECRYCKEEFSCLKTYEKVKFFCNELCRGNWWKENDAKLKKKIYFEEKECKYCHCKFTPKTASHTTYCNQECFKKYHKDNYEKLAREGRFGGYIRLRFEILKRDKFRCQYCGKNPIEDRVKLEIDHIYPKIKGGTHHFNNLTTACHECNAGKSDVLLTERDKKYNLLLKLKLKDLINVQR